MCQLSERNSKDETNAHAPVLQWTCTRTKLKTAVRANLDLRDRSTDGPGCYQEAARRAWLLSLTNAKTKIMYFVFRAAF
jgi:hypothetical protein